MTDGFAALPSREDHTDGGTSARDGGREPWTVQRLADRFELHVIDTPEALALSDGVVSLSRAELWLAAGLAAGEIRSAVGGERRVVAVHLPDSTTWLVMFLAVLRAGHVPATLPITATTHDLVHAFEIMEPAMVISATQGPEARPAPAVLEAVSQASGVSVALAEGTVLHIHRRADGSPAEVSIPEDAALLTFDLKKASSHSEDALAAMNGRLVDSYALSRHTPVIMPCPISHGSSIIHGACLSMFVGAPLILRDDWDMGALELADDGM